MHTLFIDPDNIGQQPHAYVVVCLISIVRMPAFATNVKTNGSSSVKNYVYASDT